MAVLGEEGNIPRVNDALERFFWTNHRQLDALVGHQAEYGATVRPWAYRDQGEEWVGDDFVSSYMERLTPFGVQVPQRVAKGAEDVTWLHHPTGMALSAHCPFNCVRAPLVAPQ